MNKRDKPIFYERHAVERMNQRGISPSQVERTIRRADKISDAKRDGAMKFEKSLSKKRKIVVIAEELKDAYRVISAWRL